VPDDPSADRPVTVDPRPRRTRMVAPLAVLGAVAAATAYVAVVDPNEPGHYPFCPTQQFLGLDCPGCGGMRAVHALAHGDVARAADHNLLFVLLVPFVVWGWVAWAWREWTGISRPPTRWGQRLTRATPALLVVAMVVFTVARQVVPYLASGAS
jgi:hypothetical protein